MVALFKKTQNGNKLGKMLEKEQLLSKDQYESALKEAKIRNSSVSEILFETIPVGQHGKLLKVLSQYFELPQISLKQKRISPQVINLIPREIYSKHNLIIFKKVKDEIQVATAVPEDQQILEFIQKKTGLQPKLFLTSPKDITYVLNRKYKLDLDQGLDTVVSDDLEEVESAELSAEKMAQRVPIIKIVNSIIDKAIASEASDIHIESTFKKVMVRYRIDGILHRVLELPSTVLPFVVARIKILGDLKIDEHMSPQDGRFQHNYNDQQIAIRVSVVPTLFGPKVVLRLLEMKQKMFTLRKLGLNKIHYKMLKQEIKAAQGMILVTGPTGSGKTTTLYTLLRMLNKEDVNICTIEDPIEYGIDNINQVQVKPQVGLTFANGLRSLLRQDPNILMVGEIRDLETAEIAVNAALTGHLVLSTLHTNNAFAAPQRLVEMGVPPFLVASVTNSIVGQRLVRRLCPHCKSKVRSSEKLIANFRALIDLPGTFEKLQRLELVDPEQKIDEVQFYRARGCPKCSGTGYKGRLGIYEVLKVDENLRPFILKNNTSSQIKKFLMSQDNLVMAEDGLLKVFNGQTTVEEVLRVAQE